jgi:hypothetical protein
MHTLKKIQSTKNAEIDIYFVETIYWHALQLRKQGMNEMVRIVSYIIVLPLFSTPVHYPAR